MYKYGIKRNIAQLESYTLNIKLLKYVIIALIFSAMQAASKNMQETLSEVYESEWPGHDQLYVQGQNSEMLWADLAHKLSDQVLIPLNTYQGQFPEMRVIYIFTSQYDKSTRLMSISTSYCIIECAMNWTRNKFRIVSTFQIEKLTN